MRPDQITRLMDLEEKIADVAIEECDPDEWPGAGQPQSAMDQETRGNRFWAKRNAGATLMLLGKVIALRADPKSALGKVSPRDDDINKGIVRAEREAQRLIEQVQKNEYAYKK